MSQLRRRWPYLVAGGGCLALVLHSLIVPQFAWGIFNNWLYNALLVFAIAVCAARAIVRPDERLAWWAMAGALAAWTAADIYYTVAFPANANVPFPSWADFGYLLFYPFAYVSLVLLVRSRVARLAASTWIDGLIATFGTIAIGGTFVLEPVIRSTSGNTAAVVTNLAYPIGDTLLVALVIGVFAITSFRPGRAWALLGLGLLIAGVADSIYLVQVAENTYKEGGLLDALWPAGLLLLAAAAWQPRTRRVTEQTLQALISPGVFGVVAVVLGVYEHFARVNPFAVLANAATLVFVLVRGGLVILENRRLLHHLRRDSVTDALTGLGNRRRLTQDLEHAFEEQQVPGHRGFVIGLLDLDGFKAYNDRFGHPAGDSLLERLARKLDDLVSRAGGTAYRMGGDEFFVLLHPGPETEKTLALCRVALSEHGDGFSVVASMGVVAIPEEATTPEEALRVSDQRLYTNKDASRLSAESQSRDVLVRVLAERQIELGDHVAHVAELAVLTALRLGLSRNEVNATRLAAELHDVGKAAVPDAILGKPAPLSEREWEFIRRHTVVGERIVAAAPALVEVGRIVRSSHEHVDGSGYPDGLRGDEIPLAARIVAVADAYDAMISDRPYAGAKSSPDAILELRRCGGTHFDPTVVEAFACVIADIAASHRQFAESAQRLSA